MIDLNEVRMFVHVVRAQSFAEGARGLNVPPNTLSRRIKHLESELKTRLLHRSTRKLTLTPAGRLFFERAAPAVDGVSDAATALREGGPHPSGSIRVAAPVDFFDFFQIDWVAEFLAIHPQVHVNFVLDDARANLIEDGVDVAFRGGTQSERQSAYRHIASQHFTLVASRDYLRRRGVPGTLTALSAHDCLTVSSAHQRTTWTLEGPNGPEAVNVSGRFSANSARTLLKSCVSGLGIALLPSIVTHADIRAGHLIRILPDYRREGADFNVVLPSREFVPKAVLAFIDFAEKRLRSTVAPMGDPPNGALKLIQGMTQNRRTA
jgi:DNA-binding transcriptional LysR family regulator